MMRGANLAPQVYHYKGFASPSSDTVFATLQVPRISNNGSTRVTNGDRGASSIYRTLEFADI
jgi:hypothetical protein